MRLYTRAKRRLAANRLAGQMTNKYQRKQATRTAGQLGNGLSMIDGQLYNTGATNGHGTVAVVNLGRPAAAIYAPQTGGQIVMSSSGGGCSDGGGSGGIGTHALDGPYHTGTLAQSQAPWAALDSDLQDHISDPVHHDRLHSITSTDDHSVAASRYAVLGTPNAANTLAMWATSSNGTAGNALLRSDSNGAIFLKDLYAYDKVQSQSYTAGFGGSGYRLDYGVTNTAKSFLEVDDLSVRRRMTVRELLIRKIRTTNGDIFVTSGGEVETATDLGGGSWRLTFKEDHGFLTDDLIAAQAWTGSGVYRLEATVTAVTSTKQIDISLDDGGGDTPGTVLAAGLSLSFARHGSTSDPDRQGVVYLSSDDTGAPFIRVLDGIDSWADWTAPASLKVQMGRLDSISHAILGDLEGYGLFGEAVYLTGTLTAGNGDAVMGDRGLNIQAGTVSDGGWTNASDKISFATDPMATLGATNTVGQIGAVQFVSGSDVVRRLAARVQAGTAEGADEAVIELLSQYVDPEADVPIQYAGISMGANNGSPYITIGLQGSSAAAGAIALSAPTITAHGHIAAYSGSAYDIGSYDNPFRKLYVDEIIAGTTSSVDTGHNHDDRYYLKSAVDSALAGKAAATHTHAGLVTTAALATTLADYATIAYVDAEIAAMGAPDLSNYWTKAEADGRYAALTNYNAHVATYAAHAAATSAHGVTGDLVGTGGAQTLTDKILTSPQIAQIKPSASNVLTLPDRTDTIVTLGGAQTLTSKTLASPVMTGNVGIGTASPQVKAHISSGSHGTFQSTFGVTLAVENSAQARIGIFTPNTAAGILSFGDPQDHDIGMLIYDHSNNSMQMYVNAAERMRIDSSGKVGIGTATPGGKLDVRGGTIEFDPGSGADSTRALNFNINNLNYGKILMASGSGGAMAFWTGSAGAAAERVRISASGNVGIGTTAPGYKLEVNGSAKFPHWTIDNDGRLESTDTVLGEPAVIITPAGRITAEHGRFRAALHAAVLEYDATMVSAGAQMWAHRGGAELYADLTVTTSAGSEVTLDVTYPLAAPVQQYPIGCLILLEGVANLTVTPSGGPGSLASLGLYHPQAAPNIVGGAAYGFGRTWLKVEAYSPQDGYGRYTCEVQQSTIAGTWPAGSAMVGFGAWLEHQTDGDRLGYLRITAMDDDSPAIDIVTLGAEPWDNTDLYRVYRAGKLDNLAIVTGSNVWGSAQGDLTGAGGYLLATSAGVELQDAGIDLRSDGQTRLRIDPDYGIRIFGQADRDTAILSIHDTKTNNAKIGHIAFDDVTLGAVGDLKGIDIRGAFGMYDGATYDTGYLFATANGYGSRVRVSVDNEGGGVAAYALLHYERPATIAPNPTPYSAYDVRADAINLIGRVGGMTRADLPADTRLALATMPRNLTNAQELQIYESGGLVRVDTGAPYELIVTDQSNNRVGINGTSTTSPTMANTFNVFGSAYVSGNVGIGTTSPQVKAHISSGSHGTFQSTFGVTLAVENSAQARIGIFTPNTAAGILSFGDPQDHDIGMLIYDHSNNSMQMYVNAAERMRIDSSGNVGIGVSPTAKLQINGAIAIVDGMTAPSAITGYAAIYVDSADGNLKIKFANGTTKTIATDT